MADEAKVEAKGVKETKEALVAMGVMAVIARNAYRAAGGDVGKFASGVGMALMADPVAMESIKAGFSGAGEVVGELKDLKLAEILDLSQTAIAVVSKSFADVQVQP
jgi:hypothetical protein